MPKLTLIRGRIPEYTLPMGLLTMVALTAVLGAPTNTDKSIVAAQEAFAIGEFDEALKILSRAEMAATTKELKSQSIIQQAVILEAMGETVDALISFVRASTIYPEAKVDSVELKAATIHLFRCGRELAQQGYDAKKIRTLFPENKSFTKCPVPIVDRLELSAKSPPPMPPTKTATTALSLPPGPNTESQRRAWFWGFVGTGLASFAGGLALDLGLETGSDGKLRREDFAGASFMLLGTTSAVIGLFFNPY
jgi:hypothetical protein